jgi:hypothetical protein
VVRHLLARMRSGRGKPTTGSDPGAGTSRRTVITRGLWAAAGAAGAGVAGLSVLGNGRSAPLPVAVGVSPLGLPALQPRPFSVYVRDIRFSAPDQKPGSLSGSGVFGVPHGRLQDEGGETLGSLSGGLLPGRAGQISVHRLTFGDGTLIGMGSGGLDEQEYAVVGGTGRFAGVSGSYFTKLQPGEYGRDAEFVITVAGTKG